MASTEEKLLTLLLSVEHLQHTAMEQQKAVADSLAVARETLRGYRDISDGVAKQVRDEVRNEVQRLDVAGLIGERISQDFQRLEESVANMKANADALNRDIATIHSNIVQEYNTLKGYSWKWLGGVSEAPPFPPSPVGPPLMLPPVLCAPLLWPRPSPPLIKIPSFKR